MEEQTGLSEYWSRRFAQEGMIWGSEASPTADWARRLFRQHRLGSVLVPGAGYGRNTKVFSAEFQTYGIELSREALDLAAEWDPGTHFIEGNVLEPMDLRVDAVYCYDVLHLFLEEDRYKLVAQCLAALKPGGLLVFTVFSDRDANCGIGRMLEPGTYEYKEGKYAHFFTETDLLAHFAGTQVMETGSYVETLRNPQGDAHQYILRTIAARKIS